MASETEASLSPQQSPSNFYELREIEKVEVKKFNVFGKKYVLQFQNQDQIIDLDQTLIEIFDEILSKVFGEGNPNDRVSIRFKHPRLNKDHFIYFRHQKEITAERVLGNV